MVVSSSSTGLPTLEAPAPDEPTLLEVLEGLVVLISGAVIAAPMLPGFTLCVPVLAAVAIVVLLPLVAMAAIIALVGAIVAIPYVLVRSAVVSLRTRRAARMPVSVRMPAADM